MVGLRPFDQEISKISAELAQQGETGLALSGIHTGQHALLERATHRHKRECVDSREEVR